MLMHMKEFSRKLNSGRKLRDISQRFQRWTDARSFSIQLISIIVFRVALDLVYAISMVQYYSYMKFTMDFNIVRYLLSWLALICLSPFVAHMAEDYRPSGILCTFISTIYFIPLTSYYGLCGAPLPFFVVAILYWGLLVLLQRFIPSLALAPLQTRHVTVLEWILTIGSVLFVLYISGKYTGFRITLDIINVYEIRAEAAEYPIPTVLAYILSVMPVILALLVMRWIARKNIPVLLVLVVTYIFLFSIAAQKSVFFFLALTLVGSLLYRHVFLQWHRIILSVAAIFSIFCHLVLGNIYLVAYLFNRLMYLPIQISVQIFELSRESPLSLFRDFFLDKFGFSPLYSAPIPRIVGEYRGYMTQNANNGLLGDLFINLPIPLGLFLMPLILIGCFRLLDMCATRVSEKYSAVICVYFAVAFTNGSWSTMLLSGGFLLVSVLLYVLFNDERNKMI